MNIEWENFRDKRTGEIDLLAVWQSYVNPNIHPAVNDFFTMVSEIRPVKSRQVAAVALAYARHINDAFIQGKYR